MTDTMKGSDWIAVALLSLVLGAVLCLPAALGSAGGQRDDLYEPDSQPYSLDRAGYAFDLYDLSGGVLAQVGEVQIGENAMNAYVASWRSTHGLENDEDWAAFLDQQGADANAIREMLGGDLVSLELLRQVSASQGVEVSADEVQAVMEGARESAGSEEAFEEGFLEGGPAGEPMFRLSVETDLLTQRLEKGVPLDVSVSDDEVLAWFQSRAGTYDFPDEVTSLDQLDDGSVANVREQLEQAARYQALASWLYEQESAIPWHFEGAAGTLPYDPAPVDGEGAGQMQ